jgi:hypothetical protein
LYFLGFLWRNRSFSRGYGESKEKFFPSAHPRGAKPFLRSPVEFSDMGKLARFLFFVNKMSLNRFCRQLPRVGRSTARRPESVIAPYRISRAQTGRAISSVTLWSFQNEDRWPRGVLPRSGGVRMKLSETPTDPTAQNRRRHILRGPSTHNTDELMMTFVAIRLCECPETSEFPPIPLGKTVAGGPTDCAT